jgi:hypothetical protein
VDDARQPGPEGILHRKGTHFRRDADKSMLDGFLGERAFAVRHSHCIAEEPSGVRGVKIAKCLLLATRQGRCERRDRLGLSGRDGRGHAEEEGGGIGGHFRGGGLVRDLD